MLHDCAHESLSSPSRQRAATSSAAPIGELTGVLDAAGRARSRQPRSHLRQSRLVAATSPPTGQAGTARLIGATASELVAGRCGVLDAGESPLRSRRLNAQWPRIVRAIADLGVVACTVGNDECALTRAGSCAPGSTLELHYAHWCHGFAVDERQADGRHARSLQFFGRDGRAIVKFALTAASLTCAYFDLIADFGTHEQSAGIVVQDLSAAPIWSRATDTAPLRQAWTSLRRADAVAGLFERLGVSELQAVQGLAGDYASNLPVESAQELLARAAQAGLALTVCAGTGGANLRWSGHVMRIEVNGAHVAVSAPGMLLSWQEDRQASAWLVKTPASVGLGHSLVLFDADGRFMLRIEGERHPGRPERCEWRELASSLSQERAPCTC